MMSKIPEIKDPEIYTDANFTDSSFVCVASEENVEVSMQYPILKMTNAESKCLMRREVYEKLQKAAGMLPEGYRFKIYDAWRPFALQHELYEKYKVEIIRTYNLEMAPEDVQRDMIKKFVSEPVKDIKTPPVHTTGGAVDLTIVDDKGNELDMGGGFDELSDRSKTSYYEGSEEAEIINNRRLLYNAMTSAGFTNLPSEWWHYDYGDRFWAYYTKHPAIYEGVFEKTDDMNQ